MSQHQPPGRIHGRVIRKSDGEPVTKAFVRVWDDISAIDLQTTNARGEFTSRLLFAGRYRIEAEHDGAQGAVDDVEVALQQTTNIVVELH